MRVFMAFLGGDGSAAARRLLSRAVLLEYGLRGLRIEKTALGKPFFPDRPDIHFSISHTDGAVLCAVSSAPVGCDVQIRRAVRDGLPERVCAPEELVWFDFFELWSLKESWIKLCGRLDRSLREVSFSASNGVITAPPATLYESESDSGTGPFPVSARVYGGFDGYAVAVCSAGDTPAYGVEVIRSL